MEVSVLSPALHASQAKNGCEGISRETKLQGSSRTRDFAGLVKAQACSRRCGCPLAGCGMLNKERRLLSPDAGALLKLDANNHFRDDCYGSCCWGLVGSILVSFLDCKLLIVCSAERHQYTSKHTPATRSVTIISAVGLQGICVSRSSGITECAVQYVGCRKICEIC